MKIIPSVTATAATEGMIAAVLWKLGAYPVLLLAIAAWNYGFLAVIAGFFILTWALMILWLWAFNRKKKT